ncbi:MAG TPA: DUF1015 domain-containing protein, partial [Acidobacteriaceae bacterium]|nr:DUF1015 domain-containing protein [Acidobacteriaceae bacterium]
LIRIVLAKREPTDDDNNNVYTRAAETYHQWRNEGILREEPEPALYGYSQTYTVPNSGEVRERRGFIALGHLYDYADHVVYRHEHTFPKHKSDRLALFKAIRAYPEQIYMLYSDPTFTAEHLIFDSPSGDPRPADLEILDEYNVVHRVWKLTDTVLIGKILQTMSDKKLIIADGHHRYETSVAYMHERAKQLGLDPAAPSTTGDAANPTTPPFPEAAMMMTFVNMDAPGITILPTHRVVFGLPQFNGRQFATEAERLFHVEEIPSTPDGHFPGESTLLQRLNETPGVAFIAATRDGDFLLTPKPEAVEEIAAGLSSRQVQLDVVQLHKLALEQLLDLNEDTVRAGNHVRYVRDVHDALQQVGCGNADIAFLIKPVTLAQMQDISLNLEVMPQKSTDFYPKLLSGLAMYALD